MTRDVSEIRGYHAHIYFDAGTADAAQRLREEIERLFDIEVGRFHEKPVGPHPRFSYQVAFAPALFGTFIPWLSLNREGLTVFVHADTGDDLRDHTDHVLWLGKSEELKLSIFDR